MKPKKIKCLDSVIKYCQECPYGIVNYCSIGACFETQCMYDLEDNKPTKKELKKFIKWYRKQQKGKGK